jgi:hypothetical protein
MLADGDVAITPSSRAQGRAHTSMNMHLFQRPVIERGFRLPRAGILNATVVDVAKLDRDIRGVMYALFEQYYLAISPQMFARDLASKDTVILLHDQENRLCGFSTLATLTMNVGGEIIRIVFSGDTIVERAHWGSHALAFAWIRHIGKIAAQAPSIPLFWLLIVKGHRTYRYLPAWMLNFAPDWRHPADTQLTALKDAVASARFGTAYDRESGVLRFVASQGHLAPEWAAVTPREALRPDVRFFLERNPGYERGDELVCLGELAAHNLRPLMRRLFLLGVAS